MSDGFGHPEAGIGSSEGASWIGRGGVAAGRGLALSGLSLLAMPLLIAIAFAAMLVGLGVGVYLLPVVVAAERRLADRRRRLAAEWSGVPIPVPYLPQPRIQPGLRGWWQRWRWISWDRATWRDMLWLLVDPVVGLFLALLPVSLIVDGLFGMVLPVVWQPVLNAEGNDRYLMIHVDSQANAWLAAVLGVGVLLLGLAGGPWLLRVHARFTRLLLAPTRKAELALRVRHLTMTRSDAVDAQAAELRRIERDLHDGAQARLVAMGMTLSAAERLLEDNPRATRALLSEARATSAKALDELRELVRGIHPPVLADRGLADAVRAVALDSPLAVEVAVDLPGRLEPAVESAAYFAISEVLTNAAKHAGAQRVWIDLRHQDGMLRVSVTDDGRGGARVASGGGGLHGIERRLASFDGILALHSPQGGPTIVSMELPCVLSSPKISPS